ncbi:MAG: VPLPA-CTERM sorting domain-containing protein [Parvularcula sp.]|jgi:hypothetical protein|nr:VPLPA-CTERM sorting domain-containing protein [Parvularcula sp.]
MNIGKFCAALAACAIWLPGLAGAATINVDNFSFENPSVTGFTFGTDVTGWTKFGGTGLAGVVNWPGAAPGSPFATAIPDGSQAAYSNGPSLSQNLSDVGQAGSYALSVWVGNRPSNSIPDHEIRLFAGSTLLATSGGSGTYNGVAPDDGIESWTKLVATGTLAAGDAGLGDSLRIELINKGTGGFAGGEQIGWDLVELDFIAATPPTVVPLPAAGWLLLWSLAGLVAFKRRSRT